MPKARNGAVEIEYEIFGGDRPETVLLVNGLGSQMTRWPEAFCEKLVARGMPRGVVQELEVIQVQEDEGHGRAVTPRPAPFVFQHLLQAPQHSQQTKRLHPWQELSQSLQIRVSQRSQLRVSSE